MLLLFLKGQLTPKFTFLTFKLHLRGAILMLLCCFLHFNVRYFSFCYRYQRGGKVAFSFEFSYWFKWYVLWMPMSLVQAFVTTVRVEV